MKHVAAALLVALSGNEISINIFNPSAEKRINDTLTAVGIIPNNTVVKLIVDACKGKKAQQIIEEGSAKLMAAVAVSVASNVAAEAKPAAKKEEPKKKVEEPKEEEDFGFGGLF